MGTRIAKEMVFDPAPAFRGFGWNLRDFIRGLRIRLMNEEPPSAIQRGPR